MRFNNKSRTAFENYLLKDIELNKSGIFVDDQIAKDEKIPYGDSRYGDLIWLANEGNIIFPDFFHRTEPYKGMHGYDVNQSTSKGTCFIHNPEEIVKMDEIELVDIYSILERALRLTNENI